MDAMNTLQADMHWQPWWHARWGLAEALRNRCAVLTAPSGGQHVRHSQPIDQALLGWLMGLADVVTVQQVPDEWLQNWLRLVEQPLQASLQYAADAVLPAADGAETISLERLVGDDAPAVKFVNAALFEALRASASDIHLECDAARMVVKLRLQGVLSMWREQPGADFAAQVISRVKVLAGLDIAERRVPQDGRMQVRHDGRLIDVRVSIMPSIHGEDAVLRVLDRQHLLHASGSLSLASLGLSPMAVQSVKQLASMPHGMLLVTGPTGSGKTTTLYAAVAETHQGHEKIITIEDPVEYELPGVLQIPVNERKGLTFAKGLRSILRHDPDKILVGEIRDAETAHMAVQSALTGHLVLTTVHANNPFDVWGRLQQFGVDPLTAAAALNGVVSQRLLRRLCVHCSEPQAHAVARSVGRGCDACKHTGYSGRLALAEVLVFTAEVRECWGRRAPIEVQQRAARAAGWVPMRELALDLLARGLTTREEVDRVVA
ncbi:type II/IV secretion system protein [Aquabacterium lacunae]|uniref:Type II/IV secretion system protein n=1 Tax=Aquabacterium lacunae TaxID=2528630 RepID=A0A4Q9H4I4_9BURK|nr:GspE/PulE family protein [Aquabacterium lacunae]TBO30451.1 type II/IV secretion system protein [Aquabacterium lacunae]